MPTATSEPTLISLHHYSFHMLLFLLSFPLTPTSCIGSAIQPSLDSCLKGIASIGSTGVYSDQTQFTSGNCYIKYATNGKGSQPIGGQRLIGTANKILNECREYGSYGTSNCEACYVTINYRS
jgi:hypothetical protein